MVSYRKIREMCQELTESDIFALLAKRQRRLLLQILRESSASITTIELATRIAERVYENPSADDRRSIYITLYHTHLPQLEEANVVVYDEEEGMVRPGLNFDTLLRVLEKAHERDLTWSDR